MPSKYSVRMEIAGPAAMFTRPDTGGSFVSIRLRLTRRFKGFSSRFPD
jgi:hypothetical protein